MSDLLLTLWIFILVPLIILLVYVLITYSGSNKKESFKKVNSKTWTELPPNEIDELSDKIDAKCNTSINCKSLACYSQCKKDDKICSPCKQDKDCVKRIANCLTGLTSDVGMCEKPQPSDVLKRCKPGSKLRKTCGNTPLYTKVCKELVDNKLEQNKLSQSI